MTPAAFVLSAWLAIRFFPNAQGSGISQAIAARELHGPQDRARLLSLRLAFGKILLTVLGLFGGASIGREGPTVQVGASIMLEAARWGGMAQARGLILAGSAAGIAAAFNTPLAGIVFATRQRTCADGRHPVGARSARPFGKLHLFRHRLGGRQAAPATFCSSPSVASAAACWVRDSALQASG
ncbi:putative chloride channel protein [Sinorhizobium alkalisoli]|nr:putative chloride channel protein [Sinorhizobium alkalisoli]